MMPQKMKQVSNILSLNKDQKRGMMQHSLRLFQFKLEKSNTRKRMHKGKSLYIRVLEESSIVIHSHIRKSDPNRRSRILMQIDIAHNNHPHRPKEKPLLRQDGKKSQTQGNKRKNRPPQRRALPLKITMSQPGKPRLISRNSKRYMRMLPKKIFIDLTHRTKRL